MPQATNYAPSTNDNQANIYFAIRKIVLFWMA